MSAASSAILATTREKTKMRRAKVISLRLLLGSAILAFVAAVQAADSVLKVRADAWAQFGIVPASAAEGAQPSLFAFNATVIEGKRAILDKRAVKSIGGIIFVEEAKPASSAVLACPKLSYDVKRANGARLAASFGSAGAAYGHIYDWEVLPTTALVESGENGLFTDMGKSSQYQKAFWGNLAGVNLFFLDNTMVLEDFPSVHLVIDAKVPGYPQTEPSPRSEAAYLKLHNDLLGWSQLMFTDKDVDFRFSKDGAKLLITGTPYWISIKTESDGSGRIVRTINDTALTFQANPVVYGSGYRIARYAALFRYMKNHCETQWKDFLTDIAAKRQHIDLIKVDTMPIHAK